jgi:glycosyltransferase involved in cell wall biosynthesis
LIVGATGTALDSLKSQALSLGIEDKTVFAGWLNREENNANYAQSKMYVSIPSSDGTSVSLLEAMSVDCVPIVSDLPVSREWITDGVNGIIRKKGSNPFVEALQLNNEKCFEINRKLIDKNALRTNTIKTFLKLYEQSL